MAVLNEGQRKRLEKTVERARDVAELGARASIEQLAVGRAEPFGHLSPDQRELRNRLRARARQLGDKRDARSGEHQIDHLVVECAYEHWHRMLFARFLAENRVLMHPDGVAVTLEECEELAAEEGAEDGWELAAWYAAEMLPQIFRPGSPVFELKLPPEKSRQLERLLAELPPEVFKASDSLGWVYQFWQAKKKDEVNKSEVKIGADELPAVTQLFTEPYMVQFLLHNTLGAWWVGRHGPESLPIDMPYLRFLDDGTPAAGTFDGWPDTAAEIKVLDPCCGSGHFLVAAFEILVRFRMAEEKLSPGKACDAVLRDNLHGLEIDERCTQIAAFALALAAWTFPGSGGYRVLPEMQIACSGLAPRAKKVEWLALAGDDLRLRNGMERLYELFQEAPVLGSLIDPSTVGTTGLQQQLGVAQFNELRPLLDQALGTETAQRKVATTELGVTARGVASAAAILAQRYELVMTNVPYLVRGKQDQSLLRFCDRNFTDSKADLSTVMLERVLQFLSPDGTTAAVVPQNWMFLTSYARLRQTLLKGWRWDFLARLGAGAFQTISGEVVNVGLLAVSCAAPGGTHGFVGLDVSRVASPAEKAACLRTGANRVVPQIDQLAHPDARLSFVRMDSSKLLSRFAASSHGQGSFDAARFSAQFWEIPAVGDGCWVRQQSTVREPIHFGGCDKVFRWENGEGQLAALMELKRREGYTSGKWRAGIQAWGQSGVLVSQMGMLPATLYLGTSFDENATVVIPRDPDHLAAIWCFCSSPDFGRIVREVDRSIKVTCKTVVKVPFALDEWVRIAAERYPKGLPDPYSEDPTQWVFRGLVHPSARPLQVAVARLLGYRWPDQAGDGLDDLVDDDGIVCLPAVRGEQPAATRLRRFLARAFGSHWSAHKRAQLLVDVACRGWTLERWLQNRFFAQHCKLFQNRPFIWHVWDGIKKGGFSALVNYHKLDRKLLETLTYNYLGDWIRRQQDGVKRREDGAEDRLAAAQALEGKLKLILKGEPPCDIFIRWKSVEQQPMGWNPDLNDGVRMNIRPFMRVGDVAKKGAGILRTKPNIKWSKDRGRDPSGTPWYDLGPEYGGKKGDRINDHHLTLAEKQAARDATGGGA